MKRNSTFLLLPSLLLLRLALLVATPLIFLNALAWQEKPVPALVSAVVICVVVTVFFTRVMRVPLPTGPFFGPWF